MGGGSSLFGGGSTFGQSNNPPASQGSFGGSNFNTFSQATSSILGQQPQMSAFGQSSAGFGGKPFGQGLQGFGTQNTAGSSLGGGNPFAPAGIGGMDSNIIG
mmetsp:Transcript_38775/g.28665  ORF Transcript_38775/g.28665 Transcript_38775/m.28665 type:complete len:102 (+) Transcript_38775:198-503(+)